MSARYDIKSRKVVKHMGILEIIVIILLISWAFGGLFFLPIGGGILNLLLLIVLIWVVLQLVNR